MHSVQPTNKPILKERTKSQHFVEINMMLVLNSLVLRVKSRKTEKYWHVASRLNKRKVALN